MEAEVTLAGALRALGQLHTFEKDPPQALKYHGEAAELYRGTIEVEWTTMAWTPSSLGENDEALGEYEFALQVFRQALEIRRRLLPPGHLSIAQSLEA